MVLNSDQDRRSGGLDLSDLDPNSVQPLWLVYGLKGYRMVAIFTSREIGNYPLYFQGYEILCSIFMDIEYLL